jgi:transcription elongation factor GreA
MSADLQSNNLPHGQRIYLTPEGFQKLQSEYNELKTVKIPAIAARIDEARQQGDLSENAEYHSAREEMVWAQTRLEELEAILRNVEVIQSVQASAKVQIGSVIKVIAKDKEKVFRIVGPTEADPSSGFISDESPLGEAFMNKKVGNIVSVETPSGVVQYKILDIQ